MKKKWQADDGTLFDLRSEALAHDRRNKCVPRIEEFCVSKFAPYSMKGPQMGIAKKVIVAWEAFKEAQK